MRVFIGLILFVAAAADRLTETENKQRMDDQVARLTRAAKQARSPSVWVYAARDPFYREGVPRELFGSWQDAGGQGEFVFINEHSLPSGHMVATNAALWERQVDAFLKAMDQVK